MESNKYSLVYRLMHWAIAFCIVAIVITIFLRLNWMNKDHMANIIQDHFAKSDQPIPRDEAIVLAKKIRKPMWNWHIYTGYVLTGLFCLRLLLPLTGTMKFSDPFRKNLSAKMRFQYATYLLFYAGLAASLITGLIIEFGPNEMKNSMESIHKLALYYVIPFLILHIGGVLLAEFSADKGIISRVISGGKKQGKISEE